MANIIIGNKNNIYTSAFNAAAKTVALSNITTFDMQFDNLISIYNVTRAAFFNFENMFSASNFAKTYDSNGLPVYTWTFDEVPAASANGDTLIITISIPDVFLNYTALLVISGATI